MNNTWTVQTLAEEVMKVFPQLGRQIAYHLKQSGEEETTLMQMSVLHQIRERSITASELAKHRRVSLQSASVLVQSMVERGWLIRIPNPHDRRQFLLEITPEGTAKAEATREQIVQFLTAFFQPFTDEEIAAAQVFLPALGRILIQHGTTDDSRNDKQQELKEEQTAL